MQQDKIQIAVKNMVCNRCIKVVTEELLKSNISFVSVELGKIHLFQPLSEIEHQTVVKILNSEGFELLEDREAKVVNQIKAFIIKGIHYKKRKDVGQRFSDFLALNMGMDYANLSKLFSDVVGNTIEHYAIEQRIERAKELLIYNELTLSQISYDLSYSSPQHLSRQFKQITGMTPTVFKNRGKRKKLDTI